MIYPKIQTLYQRDPVSHDLIEGVYSLKEFEYLEFNEWVFTEKINGTNVRLILFADGHEEIRGRQDISVVPQGVRLRVQEHGDVGIPPMDTVVYGEGYGLGIQKYGEQYSQRQDFVVFDVNVGGEWLPRESVEDLAEMLGFDVVPIIGTGTLDEMVFMVKEGFLSQWGRFTAEGIVARPAVDLRTEAGARIITKLKRKDFR